MVEPTNSTSNTAFHEQLMRDMERLTLLQQESIAVLKLAAYAVDAMRVLMMLEQHADMSEAFDSMLKTVCQDWRNPGAIEHPSDLVAVVLAQAIAALQKTQKEMELTIVKLSRSH